jgi:hypothetical protein
LPAAAEVNEAAIGRVDIFELRRVQGGHRHGEVLDAR